MNFDAGFVRLASNVHRQRRFLTRVIRRLGGGGGGGGGDGGGDKSKDHNDRNEEADDDEADDGDDDNEDDEDGTDADEDHKDDEDEDEDEEEDEGDEADDEVEVAEVDASAVCAELHACREYLARTHALRVNVALDTSIPPPADLIGLWAAHFRPTPLFGRAATGTETHSSSSESNQPESSASASVSVESTLVSQKRPQLSVPFAHARRAADRRHCAVVLSNAAIESAYLYQSCWFDAGWSNADGKLAHSIACDRVLIEVRGQMREQSYQAYYITKKKQLR